MSSKYCYAVYQDGLRNWRQDSHFDFFSNTTPAAGIVAIYATHEEAEADACRRNPSRDPLPGADGLPTYAICDINEESTYVTRQNVGRSGADVVRRGKLEIVKAFG